MTAKLVPTEIMISEGVRLADVVHTLIKELKKRLSEKINDVVCLAFALTEGGLLVIMHPTEEALKKGTIIIRYAGAIGTTNPPSPPDTELMYEVQGVISKILEEKEGEIGE